MTLNKWLAEKRLSTHKASPNEISNLLRVIERDIADADITALSSDRRFTIAYNAALQLATIVLHCYGYRTRSSHGGHHWITFAMLPDILGNKGEAYSEYFNLCRIKRNASDYTNTDEVSDYEVDELIQEVAGF